MKKLVCVLVILGMVISGVPAAYAEPTGTFVVTFTIESNLSIVVEDQDVSFGLISPAAILVSGNAISITNDGSGIPERLTAGVTASPSTLSYGDPSEDNKYRVSFMYWYDEDPNDPANIPDVNDAAWRLMSEFNGDITDTENDDRVITSGQTKHLWVKLEAPETTSVTDGITLTVNLTASQI